MSAHAHAAGPSLVDRKLPPVTEIGAASMIAIAAGLQFTNAFLLMRIENFAWPRFVQVSKWGLLAYLVIAGMIEYAFVYDHTRGAQLVVMTLMLALFMLNVPVLIAFTVARYERVG